MIRTDFGRIYETKKGLFFNTYTVSHGKKGRKVYVMRIDKTTQVWRKK